MRKPAAIAIAALALLTALAPAATAGTIRGGVRLTPLAPGNLWRTGVLRNATMYAQGGSTTRALVLDIHIPGQIVVSQPVLAAYACDFTSKSASPARRATLAGGSSCQAIRTYRAHEGQTVAIAVPMWATGRFLALQESAQLFRNGRIATGTTWVETGVYPQNPTAVRAPLPTTPPYAGLPLTYQPLPWKTPAYATHLAYSSEAWVCPTRKPSTNAAPLSSQGCNRVYTSNANGTSLTTFTLGGRIRTEPTEWQYVYFVGYDVVDPVGPIGPQRYMVRSKATRIKPIPAPHVSVVATGRTITAQFAPIRGARYQMSTFLNGRYGRVVSCTGVTTMTCTATVGYSGTWKVNVTPLGRKAVGIAAVRTVQVGGGLPQAPGS